MLINKLPKPEIVSFTSVRVDRVCAAVLVPAEIRFIMVFAQVFGFRARDGDQELGEVCLIASCSSSIRSSSRVVIRTPQSSCRH